MVSCERFPRIWEVKGLDLKELDGLQMSVCKSKVASAFTTLSQRIGPA